MKRLLAAMTAALLMVSVLSGAALAAGGGKGNSDPATQCKNGGYANVVGTSGTFASQSACVSYAVNGGKLYPKTPTLTSVVTGPVAGLGALVGNPQSRVAGGIADPAMLFTLGGASWVPGVAISLTYSAAYPLGQYTMANPTAYFPTAPAATASVTGTLTTWFQDNCFDVDNTLISGSIAYTITGTNVDGQSASVAGYLNCDAIPATLTATITGPEANLGALVGQTEPAMRFTIKGWHWTPGNISLTYTATYPGGTYPAPDVTSYFADPVTNPFPVVVGSAGTFSAFFQENCVDVDGTLITGLVPYTISGTDTGGHTATASGNLNCALDRP